MPYRTVFFLESQVTESADKLVPPAEHMSGEHDPFGELQAGVHTKDELPAHPEQSRNMCRTATVSLIEEHTYQCREFERLDLTAA